MKAWLECISCKKTFDGGDQRFSCDCGALLDVKYDLSHAILDKQEVASRSSASGVWRFREVVHPLAEKVVSRGEGNTFLYSSSRVSDFVGANVSLKHEGENPTGSFKDRGMTVGVTEALRQKAKTVICASTGNTSASLASYAAMASLKCVVLIPEGMIAYGKLSQALAYGAKVVQVQGNFDEALALVQALSAKKGYYVLNSLNPWRLEGQKTIVWEALMQLNWSVPDWVVVPAGNVGNTSAFGKALMEAKELKWIEKIPRIAAIQAEGANPLYQTFTSGLDELIPVEHPETLATAIRIGRPVNWQKALRSIKDTNGVVEQVSEQQIMDAKSVVDAAGIGCEPASAASVAGAKKLFENGVVKPGDSVLCVLTGHVLKDSEATVNYHQRQLEGIESTFANAPIQTRADLASLGRALL